MTFLAQLRLKQMHSYDHILTLFTRGSDSVI